MATHTNPSLCKERRRDFARSASLFSDTEITQHEIRSQLITDGECSTSSLSIPISLCPEIISLTCPTLVGLPCRPFDPFLKSRHMLLLGLRITSSFVAIELGLLGGRLLLRSERRSGMDYERRRKMRKQVVYFLRIRVQSQRLRPLQRSAMMLVDELADTCSTHSGSRCQSQRLMIPKPEMGGTG